MRCLLRFQESRLSSSTASKPEAAQPSIQRPTMAMSARRLAGVRVSSRNSPQAESTTGLPALVLSTSFQCAGCLRQNRTSSSWVWNALT